MDEYNGPDSSGSPDQTPRGPEVGHACNSCRRRKLRCSRELPSCQHCRKTASECQYETKRAKPGMKAGALDNIHRRLDAVERTLGKQQAKLESFQEAEIPSGRDSAVRTILSSLAAGLQKLEQSRSLESGPSKRRRIDNSGTYRQVRPRDLPAIADDDILSHVLEAYFIYIHPWTPIIHEGRFRRRLVDDSEREKLHLVIQSMILVARRHIEDEDTAAYLERSITDTENTRDWLVSKAMKYQSIENLQALIIIASDDIGSGHASQAWPLVGSLSRMVDYLQLTIEHDEAVQHPFSEPYRILPAPVNWTEAEERRRIFWAVFALDRFCSVSLGWNTSLTADDVRRRLPCDGITWRKENPVVTPYFGIWDKSAGRIGNPIAFLPTHPTPGPAQRPPEEEADAPSEAGTSPGTSSTVDMSTVGAYAYCIEATESLSRVTTYFLQQKVNLNDQKEFGAWLTRFKELDLRLVHWKMLLPQKWTVNVAQQGSTRMDPNLTLAHVTHNASMILLHQPIAFPLPEWPFKSRLPSLCSMDTCQTAAVEITSITNHYLKSSLPTSPLSSQFAFCVFIAARTLLLHWKHSPSQGSVAPEFWVLIQSLDTMSTRHSGAQSQERSNNLPAKYSSTLTHLHRQCSQEELFQLNIAGYTTEISHSEADDPQPPSSTLPREPHIHDINTSPLLSTQAVIPGRPPVLPSQRLAASPRQEYQRRSSNTIHSQAVFENQRLPSLTPNAFSAMNIGMQSEANDAILQQSLDLSAGTDDGMSISHMLLDQQFTGLDRVISYSDGLFGSEFEGRRW